MVDPTRDPLPQSKPTFRSRVSSAWDWTLCVALLVGYLLQTFLPEKIGWVGTLIGILIVLLVAQRLHSRRHQIENLEMRHGEPARRP
jgi:TRAP-type uncharacterized transport system fused permease subunit